MHRVLSDTLTAADDRQVTLIALLDLSATFDCVDHELLLRRLQYNFAGFKNTRVFLKAQPSGFFLSYGFFWVFPIDKWVVPIRESP